MCGTDEGERGKGTSACCSIVARNASVHHLLTTLGTELSLLNFEELVAGLLWGDAVDDESALNIVQDSEVLARLLNGDDVHEPGWVGWFRSHLAVDLDEALSSDCNNLTASQGVLETVSQENHQWQRLSQLVWAWRWAWGVGTRQLVQHPRGWGCEPLHVLPWTTNLRGWDREREFRVSNDGKDCENCP